MNSIEIYPKFCILLIVVSLFMRCANEATYNHQRVPEAGICISFDDYCVDEWFAQRELFLKYKARVTFFVTKFDTLTEAQREKLRILQRDGHEIGFHGARHVVSEYYIRDHSFPAYIQDEIVAGINAMNEAGFYPTSFAYPYSAKYAGTDEELLKYFYVVRNEVPFRKGDDITTLDQIYYSFEGKRLVDAVAFDRKGNLDTASLKEAMARATKRSEVLMVYGHEPGVTFDVKFLEEILQLANTNGMKFFRASDLVK